MAKIIIYDLYATNFLNCLKDLPEEDQELVCLLGLGYPISELYNNQYLERQWFGIALGYYSR